jgi:hypothetical protein
MSSTVKNHGVWIIGRMGDCHFDQRRCRGLSVSAGSSVVRTCVDENSARRRRSYLSDLRNVWEARPVTAPRCWRGDRPEGQLVGRRRASAAKRGGQCLSTASRIR